MLFKNIKGQIGQTITWSAASLILFIIMVLFIMATLFLSTQKDLNNSNQVEGIFFENSGNFKSQQTLFYLLNFPINENKTLRDLIFEWRFSDFKEDDLKQQIKEILDSIAEEDECYYFALNYNSLLPDKGILIKKTKRTLTSKSDLDLKKQSFKLSLFKNNQEINLKLYLGEC